ncbi:unnamed protein product, partial [Rangifer tarandus platyrhynchus]
HEWLRAEDSGPPCLLELAAPHSFPVPHAGKNSATAPRSLREASLSKQQGEARREQ